MSDVPNMDFTIDELTVLVFQHTRSRMAKRKAARELLISAREDERMKTAYLEIARRLKREEEAKEGKMKLKGLLFSVLMVFLMSFLLMGSVATAQEPTAIAEGVIVEATVNGEPVDAVLVDPTAEVVATEEPTADATQVITVPPGTSIIIDTADNANEADNTNQGEDRTFYVIGFLVTTLLGGVLMFLQDRKDKRLLNVLDNIVQNKDTRDEARDKYLQASLPIQEYIKLAASISSFVGSMNIPGVDPVADRAAEFLQMVISAPTGEDAAQIIANMDAGLREQIQKRSASGGV